MIYHLYSKDFTNGYMVWLAHGESSIRNLVEGEFLNRIDDMNPYRRMVLDGTYSEFDWSGRES